MEILEFGNPCNRKIILIHGFQYPYQIWNPYIEHYKKDFHIIVPIMSGHNPNCKEDFISFSEEARVLEDYLRDKGVPVTVARQSGTDGPCRLE